MTSELTLSASSMGHYLACPRRYYMGSVLRLPERQSVAAAIGQAVHAGVEALHLGHGEEAAYKALRNSWEHEVAAVPTDELAADPDAFPDALTMRAADTEKVLPHFHPTMVEQTFTIRLWGARMTGMIDAADDDDVRDTKTTRGKTVNGRKPRTFDPDEYGIQGTLYACGFKLLTGRWPKRILLDVLTRRGAIRQYELAPDFGELRTVISTVSDGITRGDFSPTGAAAGKCGICPYRLICEFSTERDQ
jgi:CRISPR/Cas system-associated exonuclease Cas4 (RecB family)